MHSENPECEVLVNISSGTPQMEASLYLLKAILPFPVRAIQVTSPAKRSNESAHMDTAGSLDPDALYAALQDNDPTAENRCVEVGGENAQAALLRKNILALINSYDYTAALTLAESAPELFDGGFLAALRAAKQRAALETLSLIHIWWSTETARTFWAAHMNTACPNLPSRRASWPANSTPPPAW